MHRLGFAVQENAQGQLLIRSLTKLLKVSKSFTKPYVGRVRRTKQAVERAYCCKPGERPWVTGGVAAAYGKETTVLFALA